MAVSVASAAWLLGVVVSLDALAAASPTPRQPGATLVRRGYELLPDARWLQEFSSDESYRIGEDSWATEGFHLTREWFPEYSHPRLDLIAELQRATSGPPFRLGPVRVRLLMPYRPPENLRLDSGWGRALEGLFYGAQFIDGLNKAASDAVRSALSQH